MRCDSQWYLLAHRSDSPHFLSTRVSITFLSFNRRHRSSCLRRVFCRGVEIREHERLRCCQFLAQLAISFGKDMIPDFSPRAHCRFVVSGSLIDIATIGHA